MSLAKQILDISAVCRFVSEFLFFFSHKDLSFKNLFFLGVLTLYIILSLANQTLTMYTAFT